MLRSRILALLVTMACALALFQHCKSKDKDDGLKDPDASLLPPNWDGRQDWENSVFAIKDQTP